MDDVDTVIRIGYAAREKAAGDVRPAQAEAPSIERAARGPVAPCAFVQEQFWFVDQVTPGNAAYNFSWPVRLRGRLDVSALEHALTEVVRRHDALRTSFAVHDGHPVQTITTPARFTLEAFELLRLDDPESEARRLVDEEAQRAFELGHAPLFRARLFRIAEEEHIFQIVVHHIVFDEWSKIVLFNELSSLYAACVAGVEARLPEPQLQFADVAEWQRRRLTDDVLDEHLAYWRKELAGAPTTLDLPFDRPRPPAVSSRGARLRLPLPEAATAALERLAHAEGASFFDAVLAVFEMLVHRYTGATDFLVGVPADVRCRPELDDTIGVLLNTVVLRSDLQDRPTFRTLLRRVYRRVADASAHAELPFELLVRELQPVRDLSRHPVFQLLLAVNPPEPSLMLPGLEATEVETDAAAAPVDLFLFLQQRAGGYDARWDYSTDLFARGTIERVHEHFARLLGTAVADPDRPVDELTLLSGRERRKLLVDGNGPEVAYPRAALHQLVEAQVQRSPNAVAITFEDDQLTYEQLDARANQFARRLRAAGVGHESLVAVGLERSIELLVCALGVLKAGAAYLPLDPELPPERLGYMLDDSSAAVVVTNSDVLPRIPAQAQRTICIDADWPEIALEESHALDIDVDPDSLAYVIYTSGSTGRPKGVLNTHRGIVNRLLSMQETYSLDQSDRLLQKTQTSFDVSIREMFWPLLFGARIVVARPREQGNPAYLARLIEREQVTTVNFVPSMLRLFLDEIGHERCPSLRCVLSGGEVLPTDLTSDFFAHFDCELHNLYGPTEAAVSVTTWRCEPGFESPIVPIGRPVANTQIYVLDTRLEPIPVGVWGEILIGGVQLARGYLGRHELTTERFVPNPFGRGRLYRTGDRGRWRDDGALEFGGRMDDQIKLRGFRVELGEIEAVLREHRLVGKSAVIPVESPSGHTQLAAYVVTTAAAPPRPGDEPDLLSFLRTKLPDYMVPTSVTWLEELPLLPNGKLDRNALPLPESGPAGGGYVAPETDTERAIASVWSELLGVEPVGRVDDFFALGGHSLLAARVVGRVGKAFDVDVPLCSFLQEPTVAALARAVTAEQNDALSELPPLIARPGPCEASFAQERFWFVDQVTGGSAAYDIPVGIRIRGELSVACLERAVSEIVRRHEILRTRFRVDGDRLLQEVEPARASPLPLVDLADRRNPEEAALEALREQTQTPLELTAEVLFSAQVLRLAERDHILQLVFSHLIFDGVSRDLFLRELSALYDAFASGRSSPLEEPSLQFGDFAEWQRAWLQGELLERELAYWTDALAGIPAALELPTDRTRPSTPSLRGAWARSTVPAETVAGLQAFARREGATLYMTLLAAFDVLLSRYSGQEDIVVGIPVDGRDRPELDDAIGVFVDTVVLRVDVSGQPPFRELLGRVRTRLTEAITHRRLPFERLVRALQPERELGRHPLYQTMLTLVPPATIPALGELEVEEVVTERATSPIDLTVFVEERAGRLETIWEYSTDLFERETIEGMQAGFECLLEAVVADPDRPVDELPLVPEAERRRLLATWSQRYPDYPTACLHELFEAQAARCPDAPAVSCEGEMLSYRELNARANGLAYRLRELGVGPEVPVALCLRRSLDIPVAILGVLKAGGAYVPLDPDYPAERLAFILADTRAPVLVTQEALLEQLPPYVGDVLCLDDSTSQAARPVSNPARLARPDNLAYVIYTSGSTGRPKGVQVEHRHVGRLFSATDAWFGFGPHQTWLLFHSYAFDFSVWELWGALLHGGRLVVAPFWTSRSPAALATLVAEEQVSVLNATPSLFSSVQEELIRVRDELALELVVFGGEALNPRILRPWFDAVGDGGPRLVNMYGITETTVHVTYRPLSGADCAQDISPIGDPIPDLQLFLLDAQLNPVPRGAPGEIFVGGAGVARGYLNQPELTSERFIPNPFGPGRLYRSGDRARVRSDGELEFLGRIDDQIKIRGFRIELGEIETILRSHHAVAECAVVGVEITPDEKRLAAYVVPRPPTADRQEDEPLQSELRIFLEERLPSFMVPASLTLLPELPLTANGKLDRHALPAPSRTHQPDDEFVAPQTATEAQVAGIWCDVLGLDRVSADDNFFHVGGHSLLAARVVTRVRDELDVELSLRALFEHPTVTLFARHVDAGRLDVAARSSPPVGAEQAAQCPPSFSQQQLLFIDELASGIATYNAPLAIRIRGELDREALEAALNGVVERHESLRTVFRWEADGPRQVVLTGRRLEPRIVDLTEVAAERREEELHCLLRAESRRPFDLGSDLMLRATLFALDAHEHVALFVVHHIASDGWSTEVFRRDVGELYAAMRESRAPSLPELPLQYRDFALWQRDHLRDERLERELTFWRAQLAGAPSLLQLPTDRPRPEWPTFEGASYQRHLPPELADETRRLCHELGLTPYMLLLGVFAVLLYRLSGQDDLLVSSPFANRDRSEFHDLVGFFANTIVLRVRLSGNPPFTTLLDRVRETTLSALEHQELPFERLVEALRPERSPAANPLAQVNFRTSVEPRPTLELAGAETSPVHVDVGFAAFDLALDLHVLEHGIDANFLYNVDLFEEHSVELLADDFEAILRQVLARPRERLLGFALPSEDEVGPETPADAGLIRGFREHAAASSAENRPAGGELAGRGRSDGDPG